MSNEKKKNQRDLTAFYRDFLDWVGPEKRVELIGYFDEQQDGNLALIPVDLSILNTE